MLYAYAFTNGFYLASFIIFVPILYYVFDRLIKRNDVPIIETRFRGDGRNIADGSRIIVVDRDVIEKCVHTGDTRKNFWEIDGIYYADLYDDKNNVMFHSELAEMKNQTFFSAKMQFIALKNKVPDLIEENAIFKGNLRILSHSVARKIYEDSFLTLPASAKYIDQELKEYRDQKKRIKELEDQLIGDVSTIRALNDARDKLAGGVDSGESESGSG